MLELHHQSEYMYFGGVISFVFVKKGNIYIFVAEYFSSNHLRDMLEYTFKFLKKVIVENCFKPELHREFIRKKQL